MPAKHVAKYIPGAGDRKTMAYFFHEQRQTEAREEEA
jgi:hypothetical protein